MNDVKVCPCGKLIDSGPTCKSCAPAYRAGEASGFDRAISAVKTVVVTNIVPHMDHEAPQAEVMTKMLNYAFAEPYIAAIRKEADQPKEVTP